MHHVSAHRMKCTHKYARTEVMVIIVMIEADTDFINRGILIWITF